MRTAVDVVAFAVGVIMIGFTVASAVRSTILPRGVSVRLSRYVNRSLRLVFRLWVGRSASYERRDRIMAYFGPFSLLSLLLSWLTSLFVAFVLMYLAVSTSSFTHAVELSGSSIFTLGTANPGRLGPDIISYAEAGLGLLLVTLLITYLPSIYTAFSRRENGVGLLRSRAGTPPSPTVMLIRLHTIDEPNTRLTDLWTQWETWFVDIEETHTSFAVLSFFRSPWATESWINAAGVLLDAASLWLAAVEHPKDPEANLCIRSGFLALRSIATLFAIPFDPDPQPGDAITIARTEFDRALDDLAAGGVPLLADRDAAWLAYKGWRVNYDTTLLDLARFVEAPPTPWVSDRSPLQGVLSKTSHRGVRTRRLGVKTQRTNGSRPSGS
jgi:hypothetical protein